MSLSDSIKKLEELKECGFVSQEEYEIRKRHLVSTNPDQDACTLHYLPLRTFIGTKTSLVANCPTQITTYTTFLYARAFCHLACLSTPFTDQPDNQKQIILSFLPLSSFIAIKQIFSADLKLALFVIAEAKYISETDATAGESTNRFLPYDVKPKRRNIQCIRKANKEAKQIRLFVSSTFLYVVVFLAIACQVEFAYSDLYFRDMGEERALLVSDVFPQIKKICRQRNLNFVYVDFRWGITKEESAGGKVLELCLDEIDTCRPYFLGILGERYGWCKSSVVPNKTLEETFENASRRYPWIEKYTDRSVTEIEMLYGALFYPELGDASMFYFRDAAYSNGKTDWKAPTGSSEEKKLRQLKNQILHSGLPVTDGYSSPKQFAAFVLKDLTERIERDFPLKDAKKETIIEREERIMRTFAAENTYAREVLEATLNNYVQSDGTTPLLVLGEPGSGKTAMLSYWIQKQEEPNTRIITCFMGLIHQKLHKNLYYILSILKKTFEIKKDIPVDPTELLHSLTEWLAIVATTGEKLILVFEGINDVDSESMSAKNNWTYELDLSWIPKQFPPSVRVIISCTTGTEQHKSLTSSERGWKDILTIPPLTDVEKRGLIKTYLDTYSKKLSFVETQELVQTRASSNPLYLRTILHQLVIHGDYTNLSKFIEQFTYTRNLDELFDVVLDFVEKRHSLPECPNFVRDVLALIGVSRYGMIEAELVAILKIYQQSPWSSVFAGIGPESIFKQSGVVRFRNIRFQEAVRRRYLCRKTEENKYRTLIVDYFSSKTDLSERKIQELPWQLRKLGKNSELFSFLTSDIRILTTLYTPLTKYDFFGYMQATGTSERAASLFTTILRQQKSQVTSVEYGEMANKVANFLFESGNSSAAVPLFQETVQLLTSLYTENSKEVSDVLYDFSRLYTQQAKYVEAEGMVDRCLTIRTRLFGAKHPRVADCLWSKALIKKKESNYTESIELYTKALGIVIQSFGSLHPQAAQIMKTMADVYRLQSLYDKATKLYEESLAINRSNFGSSHPSVAECLDCLGRIAKKEGHYARAQALYEEALEILRKLYGESHASIAETCMNLADVERKVSHFAPSEALYQKAIEIFVQEFGENHPEVAECYNSMGILYKDIGKRDEAVKYIEKGISILAKAFPSGHLKFARFYNNLADIYAITAKYTQAKELYLRAMNINEEKLGADHPEVSENLNAIGKIEKKRGNYDEAQRCYEKSLDIIVKIYGDNHPKAALFFHDLGVIYRKKQLYEKSWEAYMKAKELNELNFGPDSGAAAMNLNGLGMLLKKKGDMDGAQQMHESALAIVERIYGSNHDKVALTLNYLAEVARKQGKYTYDGAERLYERALGINTRCFGEEHPEVAENLNGLGQVYKVQMNYSKAELTLKRSIAISERTLGETHPHVVNRHRNLAVLYELWGRVEDSKTVWARFEVLKARRDAEELAMKNEKFKV